MPRLNPTKKPWRERTRKVELLDQYDIEAARELGHPIPETLKVFPMVSLGPFPTSDAQEINRQINDLSNVSRQQARREKSRMKHDVPA